MAKPAARLTDMHTCPLTDGPKPHVGGPIIAMGCPSVLIEGLPAARATDIAICVGPSDMIATGAPAVIFGGQMAARVDDKTVHGGTITGPGSLMVLIGGDSTYSALAQKAIDILRQLDDALFLLRDNTAREIVESLTPEEIRLLPSEVRNRLMQVLLSGYQSEADLIALKKIYSVRFEDLRFAPIDAAHREDMTQRLRNDADIVAAKQNWHTMSEQERLEVLQQVADHQADAYGIERTTLQTFQEPAEDGYITNGYYQHSDGRLFLNTDPQSSFNDFDDALDTVTHENAHRYQHELIDGLDDGSIQPGDPVYEQAQTFQLNNEYYTEDMPEYFTQPMENHSRTTGAAASGAIP